MSTTINGAQETILTFTGDVEIGDLVTLKSSGDGVELSQADKEITGMCVTKRGNIVGVLIRGIIEVGFSGMAPNRGIVKLATAGNNEIKTHSTGEKYLVLDINSDKKTMKILL